MKRSWRGMFFYCIIPVLFCVFAACAGGHLNVSAPVEAVYREALALQDQGEFAKAEVRFRQALDEDERSIPVRYGLALSLYAQNRVSDAQREFQRIRVMNGRLPHGYYGLGLVALKGKNRRFEAIEWFREALKRDPSFVDALWSLAQTRLAVSQGLFGAFAVESVREDLRRVIELAPNHPEASYTLGKTYYDYGELDDAAQAIPPFERQLNVRPDHQQTRYQLGLAYIDLDRVSEGLALLESIRDTNTSRKEQINQAIAEAMLRTSRISGDSLDIVLGLLPERERRLYYDLNPALPPENAYDASRLTLPEGEKKAQDYWKEHDPTPATAINERFVEHCRRVAYSRRHFGRGIWPWDRRGEVYIRYGEPESRRSFVSDEDSDMTSGVRQIEQWTYAAPPMTFEFVDQGASYVFDAPVPSGSGDIALQAQDNMYSQDVLLEETIRQSPALYGDEIDRGPPIRFSGSATVFRGADGKPELEVDYAAPVSELSFDRGEGRVEMAIVVFDSLWNEAGKILEERTIKNASNQAERSYQTAFYRKTMKIDPGPHRVAIHLTDGRSGRSGIRRMPVNVEAFAPGRLGMSDIKLISHVNAVTEGDFIRGGKQLVPNPAGVFSGSRPLHLYFEVYNLARDADGRTKISVEYTVFPLSGSERPVLAAVNSTGARRDQSREFTLVQEEDGTEETLYRDIAIDMPGARPGRYALQVTVTDRVRDTSMDRTALFRLTP